MNKGDIVLARLQMSNSSFKLRPVLIINFFPPYNDCLVCGISSQLHQHAEGVSYLLSEDAGYFNKTGLLKSSNSKIVTVLQKWPNEFYSSTATER